MVDGSLGIETLRAKRDCFKWGSEFRAAKKFKHYMADGVVDRVNCDIIVGLLILRTSTQGDRRLALNY